MLELLNYKPRILRALLTQYQLGSSVGSETTSLADLVSIAFELFSDSEILFIFIPSVSQVQGSQTILRLVIVTHLFYGCLSYDHKNPPLSSNLRLQKTSIEHNGCFHRFDTLVQFRDNLPKLSPIGN